MSKRTSKAEQHRAFQALLDDLFPIGGLCATLSFGASAMAM